MFRSKVHSIVCSWKGIFLHTSLESNITLTRIPTLRILQSVIPVLSHKLDLRVSERQAQINTDGNPFTPCSRFDDGNRKITSGYDWYCDWRLYGWYRFSGAAGTRMANSCPPFWSCGSIGTGWMNGGHPTVADGQVRRSVCFRSYSDCCLLSRSIKVRNCGAYYVYYLRGTPFCYLRYCSTD